MGLRMSQNEEARFVAIQSAQAMTEAIISSPDSTPVIGNAGFSNCTAGIGGCNLYAITTPAGYVGTQVAAGNLNGQVVLLTPPGKPPPRVVASSIDKFTAASFQVTATFDRTGEELGRAQLVEGLLILVPKN